MLWKTPYFTQDPVCYKRPPTLLKISYATKYCTFWSDVHCKMMYIIKRRTFQNLWRSTGVVMYDVSGVLGHFITWGIVKLCLELWDHQRFLSLYLSRHVESYYFQSELFLFDIVPFKRLSFLKYLYCITGACCGCGNLFWPKFYNRPCGNSKRGDCLMR